MDLTVVAAIDGSAAMMELTVTDDWCSWRNWTRHRSLPKTVNATGDEDNLTFTLGGTDAGFFLINKVNGAVTINSSPDYETKDSYTFVVIATDPTNAKDDRDRSNGITVLLEVINEDEDAEFTAMPTHVVYKENGTGLVAAYPAMDPDDDAFVWDLVAHSGGTNDSGALRDQPARRHPQVR